MSRPPHTPTVFRQSPPPPCCTNMKSVSRPLRSTIFPPMPEVNKQKFLLPETHKRLSLSQTKEFLTSALPIPHPPPPHQKSDILFLASFIISLQTDLAAVAG